MSIEFQRIGEMIKENRIKKGYTQQEVADRLSVTKSAVSKWEAGAVEQMGRSTIHSLSKLLDIPPSAIVTGEYPIIKPINHRYRTVPLLGTIAAGLPITAEQNIEDYFNIDSKIKADFCLKIRGDSMINAEIHEGNIVFIKRQQTLENGEIGAILIDGEATLKRFYRDNGSVMLASENPKYRPMVFTDGDMKILGKLVAILRLVD